MTLYLSCLLMLSVAVMLGYVNHKFIKMETTIAIMTGALVFSACVILLGNLSFLSDIKLVFTDFLNGVEFESLLMQGMLPYLLFAGSINIDASDLKKQAVSIGVLATLSTIFSAILIGFIINKVLMLAGVPMGLEYCFLFGALISPTDPIAVIGVLKTFNASKSIRIKLAGESLFNDGIGIVLFITIQTLINTNAPVTFNLVACLFIIKALGGVAFGLILGMLMYFLIKGIDDHKLEVLITLVVVGAGYAVAENLYMSGPLAMVVSGIFIGNKKELFSNSPTAANYLNTFWELIDEILNAVLFLLIGLEILTINYHLSYFIIGISITIVLLVRYVTVAIPLYFIAKFKDFEEKNLAAILTWGGLRGGLAIALALSIPDSYNRDIILTLTYSVVVFSIIVQGSTVKYFIGNSDKK
ncbi:MAG: sodium:proton antiporter [Legionellales bacterium]|jgi:monovalent cation:H+ antiporter, CPA1 family|nr:sodium:proton antiporter [Legionellales bacterium]